MIDSANCLSSVSDTPYTCCNCVCGARSLYSRCISYVSVTIVWSVVRLYGATTVNDFLSSSSTSQIKSVERFSYSSHFYLCVHRCIYQQLKLCDNSIRFDALSNVLILFWDCAVLSVKYQHMHIYTKRLLWSKSAVDIVRSVFNCDKTISGEKTE